MASSNSNLIVFTDNEYLNELMHPNWQYHLQNPSASSKECFDKVGGYEALKKVNTSLVQFGGVLYDMAQKKVIKTININIKHDSVTSGFVPTEYTYACAHDLTGIHFDSTAIITNSKSLSEASKIMREFIGDHVWFVMDNDFHVIRRQIPDFANDRQAPYRLKHLLKNTEAEGFNSGKLHELLTDEQKIETGWTGWNTESKKLELQEHTGCYDALSMAVFCACNDIIKKTLMVQE